jgi:hypothetical protein
MNAESDSSVKNGRLEWDSRVKFFSPYFHANSGVSKAGGYALGAVPVGKEQTAPDRPC